MQVFLVDLKNKPGELARVTEAIAAKGINIEAAMPVGMEGNEVHVAFVTSDPVKAREVLAAAGIASR